MVLWLLAAQAMTTAKFIEISDPTLPEIDVEAVLKLPALDRHERAMLDVLVKAVPGGPPEYGIRDIMATTDGRLIHCEAMPDHLTIEFPADKEELTGAVNILSGILRNLQMPDKLPDPAPEDNDPWTSILHGPLTGPDGIKLRPGELLEFYQHIFRPEFLAVTFSGPFAQDAAANAWQKKTSDWEVPKPIHALPAPEPLSDWAPTIGTFELDGPEITPDSPSVASSLLSLFALGCGKGGSLFRISRQKDGFSYRQEAVLWPTATGWTPRLVVAAANLTDLDGAAEQLKKDLLADVARWTEADRLRAAGLAEGVLLRGVPLSPFYFRTGRPVTGSPGDRAFLEAYWATKTGQNWNPSELAGRLRGVSLEALKVAATTLLNESVLVSHHASKPL
jgi:hypothetical protein